MTIEKKFQDHSAKVVLVDSSASVRQLLSEVAKDLGFSNSQAVATTQDAHNLIETDGADWVIVPLCHDQPMNGLHIVRMVSSFPELKNMRVSLLLSETELWCLPKAFECGLLSYHMKPFTKDSLTKDLSGLMSILDQHQWDGTKTAAEYLRKYLRETNAAAELLALENSILDMYPGNATQLINLAHAQHLAGKSDLAKVTLKQTSFIDGSLASVIDAKAKELFGSTELAVILEPNAMAANVLGLSSVYIIDSDDAVRDASRKLFEELGVNNIKDFADGQSAWAAIDAGDAPGMIVMEWRLPELTGPLLVQRIRSKGFLNSPVVVQSSLIKSTDMPIIREMGVANIIEKPAEKQSLLKAIIWTIQQNRFPTEQLTIELKVRALLGMKNVAEAEVLVARYTADEDNSKAKKCLLQAELEFAKGSYESARDLAIESVKGSGESMFALNILGKSLMVLRQFEPALKCFQKAQSFSPMNLERLVMMAETEADAGSEEKAAATIASAKDIDPESNVVIEGAVKVAIASGSTDAAKKILGELDGVGNVISYLNNKAVAHAKCGHNDEGIELYKKTLDAIPDNHEDTRLVVLYNMALAKIRRKDLADALVDLDEILKKPNSKVGLKAGSLKSRLQPAVASNEEFSLRAADEAPAKAVKKEGGEDSLEADEDTIASAVAQTSPGDLCCYLVFKTLTESNAELKKLISTPPRYKFRKAIERGETFTGSDANSKNKVS